MRQEICWCLRGSLSPSHQQDLTTHSDMRRHVQGNISRWQSPREKCWNPPLDCWRQTPSRPGSSSGNRNYTTHGQGVLRTHDDPVQMTRGAINGQAQGLLPLSAERPRRETGGVRIIRRAALRLLLLRRSPASGSRRT